jgi:hypothetical protein
MGSSPVGPRREWGVNGQIGPNRAEGHHPAARSKAQEAGEATLFIKRGNAATARPLPRGGKAPLPSHPNQIDDGGEALQPRAPRADPKRLPFRCDVRPVVCARKPCASARWERREKRASAGQCKSITPSGAGRIIQEAARNNLGTICAGD